MEMLLQLKVQGVPAQEGARSDASPTSRPAARQWESLLGHGEAGFTQNQEFRAVVQSRELHTEVMALHTKSPCACVLGMLGPHETPLPWVPVITCHTHCPGIRELTN